MNNIDLDIYLDIDRFDRPESDVVSHIDEDRISACEYMRRIEKLEMLESMNDEKMYALSMFDEEENIG